LYFFFVPGRVAVAVAVAVHVAGVLLALGSWGVLCVKSSVNLEHLKEQEYIAKIIVRNVRTRSSARAQAHKDASEGVQKQKSKTEFNIQQSTNNQTTVNSSPVEKTTRI